MNPFSASYYLKQNKTRVLSIVLMISMISLIYVGGLYMTNTAEEGYAIYNNLQDFVTVRDTLDDTDWKQMEELSKQLSESSGIEIFNVGMNDYQYKTMLGFTSGGIAYVFTGEDFKRFNERLNIVPKDTEIADNTVLLSEKEAKYLNVKPGDLLQANTADLRSYFGENPFKVVTFPDTAFCAYFVTGDVGQTGNYLLTWSDGSSKADFLKKIEEFKLKYDKLSIKTYEERIKNLRGSFKINDTIYYSIIVIVSIVFAITTNAVFVGMYDRRKHEFALYQGLGIPVKAVYKKIAAEILCMNGLGLLIGAGFSLLSVSLLNQYIYHQDGLSMWYYHITALLATLLCDLAVIVPGIGLRISRISKEIKDVDFL